MDSNENKKNLLSSLLQDVEITSSTYAQMHERLRLRDHSSRFFITYYSILTIIFGLVPFFFEDKIAHRALFDFITISISIVALVSSLLISFAKYQERAWKSVEALDALKRLKKELGKYTDDELRAENFKKYDYYIEEYHQVVDRMELRTNIDYYRACKVLASSNKDTYKARWEALSCFVRHLAHCARIMEFVLYIALFVFPFIALCLCLVP